MPSIRYILKQALLAILVLSYIVFGYTNFTMTISEMEILLAGMTQIQSMVAHNQEVSLMGQYLARQLDAPTGPIFIPALHISYWTVTVVTVAYAVWSYLRQSAKQ